MSLLHDLEQKVHIWKVSDRWLTREILAKYLQISPESIQFHRNPWGKPSLVSEQNPNHLEFNISHSQDILLLAVTLHMPVGIDIQYHRTPIEAEKILKRFFSSQEQEAFFQTPIDQRLSIFYQIWTRHEALHKAMGISFSQKVSPEELSQWSFQTLNLGEDYTGVVCLKGNRLPIDMKW